MAAELGARLARLREDDETARVWQKAAAEIHADICANTVDERGVFCQHYETTALDASVLLMPLLRFLPPEDPRIQRTVLAISNELTRDGLVLRYQVDQTDDGLLGEEGTFTTCSFWLVSALSEIGEHRRARDLCEKAPSYASPLLLYAEEIDSRSGRHLRRQHDWPLGGRNGHAPAGIAGARKHGRLAGGANRRVVSKVRIHPGLLPRQEKRAWRVPDGGASGSGHGRWSSPSPWW